MAVLSKLLFYSTGFFSFSCEIALRQLKNNYSSPSLLQIQQLLTWMLCNFKWEGEVVCAITNGI